MTAAISDAMVQLLHRYTGRGPTSSRTTVGTDLVVCVMGAALTKGERTLVTDGRLELVLSTRRAYQDSMRADAISAVEKITGRRVLAFMSNNHVDPDLAAELFVLEPLTSAHPNAPVDTPRDAVVRELIPPS
ncbi:MAG TPA: Na-translocating system protein MpsC family protein [Solirubrobacteraceae bacterium]|jgi:uncharacterized protein YbcI|nr:Na-translocating system protein MpsC family protein [Solirubrobacteraceae bacterium]